MIINPIISASSGLKPKIIVTAPTGSTVTCTTPGGIVIQGIEVSGTWTFANLPGPGTYTINASLGTQSKTESVVVDRVAVFEVEIIYRLYLYNLGDECEDVTGGWSNAYKRNTNPYYARMGTMTKSSNSIVLSCNTSISDVATRTTNKVDITNFNSLKISVTSYTGSGAYSTIRFGIDTVDSGDDRNFLRGVSMDGAKVYSVDISENTGIFYIIAQASNWTGYRGACSYTFNQVWLE